MTTTSDTEIIQRVIDGDVNAFELLLNKYQGYVFTIVKKHVPFHEVEEVAHDVFIKAYQSLPTCQQTDGFQHWLASIAVRTCYDFWRRQYRNKELPMCALTEQQQHWLESKISNQSNRIHHEQASLQQAKDALDWALSKLSPEDRMVVEFVYLEGLTGKEAAKLLGWSVANVKVRSFRARKKLQKLLSQFPESQIGVRTSCSPSLIPGE